MEAARPAELARLRAHEYAGIACSEWLALFAEEVFGFASLASYTVTELLRGRALLASHPLRNSSRRATTYALASSKPP